MSRHIRFASPHDRAALVEQFLLLNTYEEPFAGNRRLDRAGAEASLLAAEKRVADTAGVKLVAECGGSVVGHLFLTFERDAAYVREELQPFAYISELFVRAEARRRGIGRALMAEAERIAAERGMSRIMVGVLTGNAAAEGAYHRFGFRAYATEMSKPIRRPG